jgi:hypothetical protein
MRILLIGEFSGLHNNLKDGLQELGHEVVLASTGDGWKNFPSDINWLPKRFKGRLGYIELLLNQYVLSKKLKNYDVVQFISPFLVFEKSFGLDEVCFRNFMRNNKKCFFVVAGGDPVIWKYWQNENDGVYSNYIAQTNKCDFSVNALKLFHSPLEYRKTEKLVRKANGIIPIMYEYAQPYRSFDNLCDSIPIPINLSKTPFYENVVHDKIIVFHGLNRRGAKGTQYIEEAFDILKQKYPDDFEFIIDGKMEFNEYRKFIKRVNVVIDQTNTYSLGLSGLDAMCQGKVTLGGAETVGMLELKYDNCPAINIKPNAIDIVKQIESLIIKKMEFNAIGKKSRDFIDKHHNHVKVAQLYLDTWEQS